MDVPISKALHEHPPPIVVTATDSLPHALQVSFTFFLLVWPSLTTQSTTKIISNQKIHAVPVYDEKKKQYIRFIDLLDFVFHIFK